MFLQKALLNATLLKMPNLPLRTKLVQGHRGLHYSSFKVRLEKRIQLAFDKKSRLHDEVKSHVAQNVPVTINDEVGSRSLFDIELPRLS